MYLYTYIDFFFKKRVLKTMKWLFRSLWSAHLFMHYVTNMNQAPDSENTFMSYKLLLNPKTQLLKTVITYYLSFSGSGVQKPHLSGWFWLWVLMSQGVSQGCRIHFQDGSLMFVKLALAVGKKSYRPLHRAAWNTEAPKETKWKSICFMTKPQSHCTNSTMSWWL